MPAADEVIPLESPTLASPLERAAHAFAAARGRPAVFYFLAHHEPIGTKNVRELGERMPDEKLPELDLVIHSSGGDIHAAYQLISFLRRRTDKLMACVPRYARSAATLLCIGADLIIIDELAGLGPLDAQIYDGTNDAGQANYKSALNQLKGLERLRDFSQETLFETAASLWDKGVNATTEDTLRNAREFVRVVTAPLFDKIESHRLGDYSQALAIGEEYGKRLLRRLPGVPQPDQERIVRKLVHEYPSHEYVIDYQELVDLHLPVRLFEGEEKAAARVLANHVDERLVAFFDPLGTRFDGHKAQQEEGPAEEAGAEGTRPAPPGRGNELDVAARSGGRAQSAATTFSQGQSGVPTENPWR
ncbi:MAG TPA: hypothetical protein VHG90_12455 [Acidimicrobiales bacterium]|nr:hypothetical protein [Acidimicrobiales bacterium]